MYIGPSLSAYSHWGVAFGAGRVFTTHRGSVYTGGIVKKGFLSMPKVEGISIDAVMS